MTTRKWINRFAMLALAAIFSFSLAACNTMEGAGKDVEASGEAIQDAAD